MPIDLNNLPTRLLPRDQQPEGFYRQRRGRFFLKSAEFKKIYNKAISPYLRKQGFKASGFSGFKSDENFTYMVKWNSGKYGGEGCMDIYLHPVEFTSKQEYAWSASRSKDPNHAIFTRRIGRNNPNDWVDIGTNVEEAQETCEFLLHHLQEAYPRFVQQFEAFPANILEINAENFDDRFEELYTDFGLAIHGRSKYYAALWLARFHGFYEGNSRDALAEIARDEILAVCEEEQKTFFNGIIDELKAGVLHRY